MHRVIELGHDGLEIRPGLLEVRKLFGQEGVTRLQSLKLFESERVDATELVEGPFCFLEPGLLLASHKGHRLGALVCSIGRHHLVRRIVRKERFLVKTKLLKCTLQQGGALELLLIHLHFQRVHRICNRGQALTHRSLALAQSQQFLMGSLACCLRSDQSSS